MFQLTVLYGHPEDAAEFDRYYKEVHTPLVEKIQGLKGLSVTKFTAGPRGEQPPYYQMAAMYADTREEFDALMSTPEGKVVGRDVRNFATGGATLIFRVLLEIELLEGRDTLVPTRGLTIPRLCLRVPDMRSFDRHRPLLCRFLADGPLRVAQLVSLVGR